MSKTESVRIPVETVELLRKLRKEKGIMMTEAVRIAVNKVYGQKNSK
jgi:hypothetical protein